MRPTLVIVVVATATAAAALPLRSPLPTVATLAMVACFVTAGGFQRRSPNDDPLLGLFLILEAINCVLSPFEKLRIPMGDSPISASAMLAATDPELRNGAAALRVWTPGNLWLLSGLLAACWLVSVVHALRPGLPGSLRHSLGRGALIGLAGSFAALHAVTTGLLGASHRFYVPMYSALALGAEAAWGVAASELVALASGFTFVSAGLAKLRNTSPPLGWLSGHALCRHLRLPLSCDSYPHLYGAAAVCAVAFELLVPWLLLGGRRGRLAFAALATLFHFIIGVFMAPRYPPAPAALPRHPPPCKGTSRPPCRGSSRPPEPLRADRRALPCTRVHSYVPQASCYLLLFRPPPTPPPMPSKRDCRRVPAAHAAQAPTRRLVACLGLLLLCTHLWRLDTWPLTYVPMYSTDLPDGWGQGTQSQLQVSSAAISLAISHAISLTISPSPSPLAISPYHLPSPSRRPLSHRAPLSIRRRRVS